MDGNPGGIMGKNESSKQGQLSIAVTTKDRLDRYKAVNKEDIIAKYGRKRRMVTNTDAINYLIDQVGFEE